MHSLSLSPLSLPVLSLSSEPYLQRAGGGRGRRAAGMAERAANCGRGRSADWRAGLLLPTTTATAASSAWKAQARRARLDDAAGIGVLLAALERIRMPVLSFLSNPLTMQALWFRFFSSPWRCHQCKRLRILHRRRPRCWTCRRWSGSRGSWSGCWRGSSSRAAAAATRLAWTTGSCTTAGRELPAAAATLLLLAVAGSSGTGAFFSNSSVGTVDMKDRCC